MGKKKHKHKKKKSKSTAVATAAGQKSTVPEDSFTTSNNTVVSDIEDTLIISELQKPRRLSQAFVNVLRPKDAAETVVDRTESRNAMRYVKFMFLGLTRTNQTAVAKGTNLSSSASTNTRRTSSKTSKDALAPPTTFPCAFESSFNGSTIVVDVGPTSTFDAVKEAIGQHLLLNSSVEEQNEVPAGIVVEASREDGKAENEEIEGNIEKEGKEDSEKGRNSKNDVENITLFFKELDS